MSNADAPLIVNLPGYLQATLDGRHPSTCQIVQFFGSAHLPDHLQRITDTFQGAVEDLLHDLPDSPELTVAIRKLLEAKDAAVRAAVAHRAATTGGVS